MPVHPDDHVLKSITRWSTALIPRSTRGLHPPLNQDDPDGEYRWVIAASCVEVASNRLFHARAPQQEGLAICRESGQPEHIRPVGPVERRNGLSLLRERVIGGMGTHSTE